MHQQLHHVLLLLALWQTAHGYQKRDRRWGFSVCFVPPWLSDGTFRYESLYMASIFSIVTFPTFNCIHEDRGNILITEKLCYHRKSFPLDNFHIIFHDWILSETWGHVGLKGHRAKSVVDFELASFEEFINSWEVSHPCWWLQSHHASAQSALLIIHSGISFQATGTKNAMFPCVKHSQQSPI